MRENKTLSNLFKSFFSFVILSSFLSTTVSISAQTRRTNPSKTNQNISSKKTAPKCSGGWSGTVVYKKTLKDSLQSDEPGIRSATDRIKHKTSRDYDYTGRAVVNGKVPGNPSVKTKVNFTDDDLNWGEEKVFDTCNSRESGHWFIIESNDDRRTTAQASGSAENFNLYVDESGGTYSFSMRFPKANGKFKREEHVKKSGHCQPQNNLPFDRSTDEPTVIEGGSFSIDSQKIDPDNPNILSGTKTWGDDGTGAVRSFVFQVTWYFTRCPQELLITDLKFEDMKFPTWNDWQEITEERGTIDGNLIRIKANVANMSDETTFAEISFKETYKGDKWDGARPDIPLKDNSVSVRLEAGEEREVEILWDSAGYSWFDDGRPRLVQRIKVEAWENYKLKDEMTKNLKISPKPIVFVPGIWTDAKDFEIYQNLLTVSHSYGWKAHKVIDVSSQGTITTEGAIQQRKTNRSVYDNADNLAKYVENVRASLNAWHIDMLAHSTGGLVARLYVHKQMEVLPDNYPVVKHLLMLGTPNNGVPCAESMKNNDAFQNNMQTAKELMPGEIALFNQYVTQRKGTKFSALIGNSFPTLCAGLAWNDGFVSVESAKFGLTDFAFTKAMHPNLLSAKSFGEFVKPHVVTGPRGTYPLPIVSEEGGVDGRTAVYINDVTERKFAAE